MQNFSKFLKKKAKMAFPGLSNIARNIVTKNQPIWCIIMRFSRGGVSPPHVIRYREKPMQNRVNFSACLVVSLIFQNLFQPVWSFPYLFQPVWSFPHFSASLVISHFQGCVGPQLSISSARLVVSSFFSLSGRFPFLGLCQYCYCIS